MKNILEKINKQILLIAIAVLFIRVGNFAYSFIPKPFEILFVVVSILTAILFIFYKKIKDFFDAIPEKILIALGALLGAIFLGWGIASFIKGIPTTLNMLLEFGTFIVGLVTFLFVLVYANNDFQFSKKYFYALLTPAVFIPFVIFPQLTPSFLLASDGNFVGLTTNVNIISKILLIPALFFIVHAVLGLKEFKKRILYIFCAVTVSSLIFWISSRGAILGLILGTIFTFIISLSFQFNWKKNILNAVVLIAIIVTGFIVTPYSRKQMVLNRVLNSDAHQLSETQVKSMGLVTIIVNSVNNNTVQPDTQGVVLDSGQQETRLEIWPYYIKNIIIKNPFGIGPNTHVQSYVKDIDGNYVSSGPHNTFLELLLWGGVIALLSFLYILYSGFVNLFNKIKNNPDPLILSLLAVLFALSITIIFDDSLSLYCFWVVLALSLLPWNKSQ